MVCVYLFHELPEAVRRRAAAEFARVLRPGGLVVFADSVQLGDRPGLERPGRGTGVRGGRRSGRGAGGLG